MKENEKIERTYFRVIMPETFANSDWATIEEAQQKLISIPGETTGDNLDYWKKIQSLAYIVKVTEIIEKVDLEKCICGHETIFHYQGICEAPSCACNKITPFAKEEKAKPTREDVEKLKSSWLYDPNWDLHTTDGFEDYRDELLKYEEKHKAQWAEQAKLRAIAQRKTASAFPEIETGTNYDGEYNGNISSSGGLTKRELIAAMAMQGFCGANQVHGAMDEEIYIRKSVHLADLLLEQLAK